MADKIVQVTASKITANSVVYSPKAVDLPVPKLAVGNSQSVKITTSVENPRLNGIVTNMGEESVPNPYLFKRLSSDYLVADTVRVTYKSTKLDLTTTSDLVNVLVNYNRHFEELLAPLDNYKFLLFGKVLADPVSSQDILQVGFRKSQQDSVSVLDPKSIELLKQLQSSYTVGEQINLSYQKVSLETVFAQDVFAIVVDFTRNFESLVDATDDFYGLANVDDDQTARFGKTLASFSETTTELKVAFDKQLLTNFSAQEQLAVSLGKPLFSQSTLGDQNKFTLTKPAVDLATFTTQQVFVVGKQLASETSSSTQLSFTADKTVSSKANTIEVRTVNAAKQLIDPAQTISENKFSLTKPSTDSVISASTQTLTSGKVLNTQISSDDVAVFSATKQLLDTLSSDSTHSVQAGKYLDSEFSTQDEFSRVWLANSSFSSLAISSSLTTIGINTVLLETFESSSTTSIQSSKHVISELDLTDTFIRIVNYNRDLLDTVNSTDDFYGEANIDDDQTARFGKNVVTILASTDTKLIDTSKVLSTQMMVGEQRVLQVQKLFNSSALFEHQTIFSTGKSLLDFIELSDSASKQFTKIVGTSFAVQDDLSLQVDYFRTVLEQVNLTDSNLKSVSKVTVDSASLEDSFSRVVDFNRALSSQFAGTDVKLATVLTKKQESTNATDVATKSSRKSLLDAANTSQLVQAVVEKGLVSQASTGEFLSFFKFGNRFFNEIVLASNPGVINNQSYFLESYAEPGYAGTNTYIS
jgi:hypothetical protein